MADIYSAGPESRPVFWRDVADMEPGEIATFPVGDFRYMPGADAVYVCLDAKFDPDAPLQLQAGHIVLKRILATEVNVRAQNRATFFIADLMGADPALLNPYREGDDAMCIMGVTAPTNHDRTASSGPARGAVKKLIREVDELRNIEDILQRPPGFFRRVHRRFFDKRG